MSGTRAALRKNRTLLITLTILLLLFILAARGMDTGDWVVTVLRGLSVGAITFLVASGLSLIFGLLDVLNLAHGTLFMLGAYLGWTVYVRPDTFVDLLAPILLLAFGLLTQPLWASLLSHVSLPRRLARIWPWVAVAVGLLLVVWSLAGWPIALWNPAAPANSPSSNALAFDLSMAAGQPRPVYPPAESPSFLLLAVLVLAGLILAAGLAGLGRARAALMGGSRLHWRALIFPAVLLAVALAVSLANAALTTFLQSLGSTVLFFIAILIVLLTGGVIGGIMEATVIRPLYARPIYQLMLTLGLGVAGAELVMAFWGRTEFTFPKPEIFAGSGPGCPATSLASWLQYHCATIELFGARVRVYNEVFVIAVGVIVLIAVTLLIQRSRLGMVIRAGVQDSEMVEALGINVRKVFTQVFALGVALASMGGIIAAPSMGVSPAMGETLLLTALIALAIGGLTSFPGAALGAVLVGLLQQFIIKYGQIGIAIPGFDKPFKPTPPLVPASIVLLMVIILLIMPQGLLGRKE
jgi:branched-chain amino acid transport system permease protein